MAQHLLTDDDIIRVLSAGGGLRISAAGLLPETLLRYAEAAKAGNARLEIVMNGGPFFPGRMAEVSKAGGGAVLFDLT